MKFSLRVPCLPLPLCPPSPPSGASEHVVRTYIRISECCLFVLLQLEIFYSASKGYSLASKEYNHHGMINNR